MSNSRSDLDAFFRDYWRVEGDLVDDADVFGRLGVEGDDAFDFIDKFAERFAVDMSGYRWYFHHGEEGWNLGGLFFPPPYRRVIRIPITPSMLTQAIQTKRWPLEYPVHQLPAVRWDGLLNVFLIIAGLGLLVLLAWRRMVG